MLKFTCIWLPDTKTFFDGFVPDPDNKHLTSFVFSATSATHFDDSEMGKQALNSVRSLLTHNGKEHSLHVIKIK